MILLKNTLCKNTLIRGWSPAIDVPGSTLLLKGSDPYTMTFQPSTLKIVQIDSQSETKNVPYMGQSLSDYRPSFEANVLNGRGAIRFNGTSWLEALSVLGSDLFSANETTIYAVTKQDLLQQTRLFYWFDPTNTKSININCPWEDGVVSFDTPYPSARISQGGHSAKIDWAIWTFIKRSNTKSEVYYNGQLLFSGTYSAASISVGVSQDLYIADKFLPMTGYIAELGVYNRAVSYNEMRSIYFYLKNYFGL